MRRDPLPEREDAILVRALLGDWLTGKGEPFEKVVGPADLAGNVDGEDIEGQLAMRTGQNEGAGITIELKGVDHLAMWAAVVKPAALLIRRVEGEFRNAARHHRERSEPSARAEDGRVDRVEFRVRHGDPATDLAEKVFAIARGDEIRGEILRPWETGL